ncbi:MULTISPECIES: hypothetical protein [Mycobacteroides]|uniref:hypothetical protein n=1 Tax=Mycobacteroides TaxID=670516 RepID=UPI000925F9D6|nr:MULTISPECIES: hypothetical protein [Mycobacteroides]SHW93728.1 putative secreted protein [Mycobacteroides abscessus subsp. abscessus]SKL80749.1 putative secreted protein [Mycobacteroides abscessus subsp. abscessus]SKM52947.1 putative secreted protein [Mycobacteroides abscessus subsp. abscessus]SLK34608.1 putative secreted protein [Mycobacteroides abscessus subsp. abscessus]
MATLAGEAAIRIVPSLRGFKPEADRRLKSYEFKPIEVGFNPNFKRADVEIEAWRQRQERNAINVPVRGDFSAFRRDLQQVEHIFKRSALSRAVRLNIKVIGLDALPALAYAAGSAASGLDALGKSAFALPGLLGGAAASVGALLIGMRGISDALQAYGKDSANAGDRARQLADDNRTLGRSYREYQNAIRDTRREIQDLNAENRRSSLNVADAVLNVEEAADRLRKGGQRSLLELRRDQLNYLQAIDRLQEVQTKAQRTAEDTRDANARGVENADRVVDALDQIAKNTDKINSGNLSEVDKALGKLAPNARATVEAIHGFSGAWNELRNQVQDNLFEGMDRTVTDLGQRLLPGLQVGLSRVASGLNANFRTIGESLGSKQNGSFLERIFGNTDVGLRNLARGMNPLITGILRLIKESSDFLPRLGIAAERVFSRFDAFTARISKDGSLDRWIDSGLQALSSLGNAVINIGSIISSVSRAFDTASGTTGGFVGTFDRLTDKWARFLKSTEGQNTLVRYFKEAREFIGKIGDAIQDMRPILRDLVEVAREWSGSVLGVVGSMAKLAKWVEDNTSLVKTLLATYLTLRTARPFIEGLTTSWSNYNKVLQAAANNSTLSRIPGIQGAADNMKRLRGELPFVTRELDLNAVSTSAAGREALRYGEAVDKAGNHYNAFGRKIESGTSSIKAATLVTSGGLDAVGKKAVEAGELVGGAGKVSMLSRIGALAGALGPAAAITIAIPLAVAAIDRLGQAHRDAAKSAQDQATAIGNIVSALDQVTGAATQQSLTQAANEFQSLPIQGFGNVNVNEAFTKAGINPQQALLAAIDPTKSSLLNSILAPQDEAVAKQVEQSKDYQEFKGIFDANGIDAMTIAKAMNGDPEALEKFRKVASQPQLQTNDQGQTRAVPVPDLTRLAKALPNPAPFQAASGLRAAAQKNYASAENILGATQAARGRQRFTPEGMGYFARWAPGAEPVLNSQNRGVITLSKVPDESVLEQWRGVGFEIGEIAPNGSIQITLSPEATAANLQSFANGGLVKGIGGPRDDLNLARVSPYEHITQARAVKYYGAKLFDDLNNMRIPRHFGGGFPFDIPLQPPPVIPAPPVPVTPPAPPSVTPIGPAGGPMMVSGAPNPLPPQRVAIQGAPAPVAPPALPAAPAPSPSDPGLPPGVTKPLDATSVPAAPEIPAPPTRHGETPGIPSQDFPGALSGQSLPGRFNESGLQRNTIGAERSIGAAFPQISTVHGWREPDGYNEHFSGQAADFMIPGAGTPEGFAMGDQVKDYAIANAKALGIDYVIWNQTQWNADGTSVPMENRGSATQNHKDHVHVHTTGGGYPQGDEQYLFPGLAGIPGNSIGAPGSLGIPGVPGAGDLGGTPNLLAAIDALPSNIQPQSIASQVGSIALQSIGGFFGLDLSYLDSARQVGNFYLGKMGKSGQGGKTGGPEDFFNALGGFGGGGGGGADGAVSQAMNDYTNGAGGISPELQSQLQSSGLFNENLLGTAQSSAKGGGGRSTTKADIHARYGALIAQICRAMGVDPATWVGPLEEQIWTESKGDPLSVNPNDTNGRGGTQRVEGLFNFLGSTFQSYKVPGFGSGSINDPVSQIAAAINYTKKRWGVNPQTGAPNQIGRGVGFKNGGWAKGLAWLSNGEYRTNGAATQYYGPQLFNALNNMEIPRSAAKGFAGGGFPWLMPPPPAPDPGAAPGAAPAPAPNPAPAGPNGQTPGPLALTPPGAQPAVGGNGIPSTGGAPGPGATAPAPDPGVLPTVKDAMSDIGGAGQAIGMGGQPGSGQPGADPTGVADPRATLGASPTTNNHVLPAISSGIQGAAATVGSLASMAASAAGNMFAPGAGSAAGAGIQAGAQMAGQAITGVANVISSLLVGTATNGSTQSASGVPMLARRQPQQTGVPRIVTDNRQYHVTNLDEFKRVQATSDAQAAMPYIGKYGA